MPQGTTNTGTTVTVTESTKQHVAWLESMGAFVALMVMAVYGFTVVAPYFLRPNTAPVVIDLIRANKATVDLITTAVVMFYFGASVGRRKDQDTMHTLAQTNAAQTGALMPPTEAIPVAPGEQKVVVGKEE